MLLIQNDITFFSFTMISNQSGISDTWIPQAMHIPYRYQPKGFCTWHASGVVRLACLRLLHWVQCTLVFICTRVCMKQCVRYTQPWVKGWLRPESQWWGSCAAAQNCVLHNFWHHIVTYF